MEDMKRLNTIVVVALSSILLASCSTSQTISNTLKIKSQADTAYQKQDCATAIQLYQKLSRALPSDTHSLLRQGNCFARQEKYQAAQKAYEEALQRDPTFTKAWHNLSYIQAQQLRQTTLKMLNHTDPANTALDPIRRLAKKVLAAYNMSIIAAPKQQELQQSSNTNKEDADSEVTETGVTKPIVSSSLESQIIQATSGGSSDIEISDKNLFDLKTNTGPNASKTVYSSPASDLGPELSPIESDPAKTEVQTDGVQPNLVPSKQLTKPIVLPEGSEIPHVE